MNNIILWVALFGFGLLALYYLANSATRNYCHCIREPRGDKDEGVSQIVKPLCTEICADPDLIRVMDSHGADTPKETEEETAKAWERIRNCPLKADCICRFEKKENAP